MFCQSDYKGSISVSICSGLQNVFTNKVLDLIVVLAKFYIYKCKWHETASNFKAFLRILTNRYTLERYLHITSWKLHEFDLQWLPYKGLLI